MNALPKGWDLVPLEAVAEVRLGRQRSPKNHSGSQMRPYVRAANVGWRGLLLDDVMSMNFTDSEMEVYRLQDGDLLLNEASGSAAEVGKPAIWRGEIDECAFQNTLLRVRPHGIDPSYLLHYFRHQAATLKFAAASRGVGIRHLGREALASWPVPRPPAEEQRRIVEVLSRADGLRDMRRDALAQLVDLEKHVFHAMFGDPARNPMGWRRASLGEMLDLGPQNGLYKAQGAYGAGTPIVRIDAFYDGVIKDLKTLKRVRLEGREVELYGLAPGDILINRVNSLEYLGKCALVPEADEVLVYESNMMRLRVKSAVLAARYLVHFLQTSFVKSQILSAAKSAINQSSINQRDVKDLIINIPPLAIQERFVDRALALDEAVGRQRASLAEVDALFASLQERAFRGTL